MFVRKKPNNSGITSVQVIDKSSGRYRVVKTIGSSSDEEQINRFVEEGKRYIQQCGGVQEIDFYDYRKIYAQVLESISSHKLVGVEYVFRKDFQ